MSSQAQRSGVLVTGASGYVGGLLAAALLAEESGWVVLPIRQKHDPNKIRAAILNEARAMGHELSETDAARLVLVPLPLTADMPARLVADLAPLLAPYNITDIVHAAGCLSYFNAARLEEGNQNLTRLFLELGRRLGVRRFVYVSTAYASGFVSGPIHETLHGDPPRDPNEYTRSKRLTEHLVAQGGLPYLIVRPSIVVGNSRDGRYAGKPYGAYQVWTGLCKFLCDRYRPVIHAVAPDLPLNFVHQDAVQAGFLAAFRHAPDGSIVHLVSRDDVVPTTRQYWHLWMKTCGRPREVRYYDRLADLPRDELDEPQRLLVEFAESNIEISTHHFRFETSNLDRLRRGGLAFVDATVDTMQVCLDDFLSRNPRALAFMNAEAGRAPGREPLALDMSATVGKAA
jgi:nucleoside-diphosphate-sugar epimerase